MEKFSRTHWLTAIVFVLRDHKSDVTFNAAQGNRQKVET